jgi:hypothetical protein
MTLNITEVVIANTYHKKKTSKIRVKTNNEKLS